MTITINGTTGIAGVDGSASVPAFKGNDADTGIYYPTANTVAAAAGGAPVWNASSTFGFKNRIINGSMAIDQRNAGASVTISTANVIYSVDRFYLYALGAAITAQRVSSGRTDFPFALRATGASSNTYCEIGQRIEAANCTDLVGASVTVSFFAARSSGTSLTVRLSYANSSDNFGSITSIATQSVTIGSTLAQYTVTFNSLPAQAANGLQIGLEFGALGAGQTASATGVQLEVGPVATSFDFRSIGTELALCQRYYQRFDGSGNASFPLLQVWWYGASSGLVSPRFYPTMRAAPTFTSSNVEAWSPAGSTVSLSALTLVAATPAVCRVDATSSTNTYTPGQTSFLMSNSSTGTGVLQFSAEL